MGMVRRRKVNIVKKCKVWKICKLREDVRVLRYGFRKVENSKVGPM